MTLVNLLSKNCFAQIQTQFSFFQFKPFSVGWKLLQNKKSHDL